MRELPNAIEHEKKLLSAMFINNGEAIPTVIQQITAEDFYRPSHRDIYKAITAVYNQTTEPISELTVLNELKKAKARVEISEVYVLMECEFTTARVNTYIREIKRTARLRQIIEVTASVADSAYNGNDPAELQVELEKLLAKADEAAPTKLEHVGDIAAEVIARTVRVSESKELTGTPTGLAGLDKITNGLQTSDLIFLAARPSMGKTALALNIAVNAADSQKKVALFSLEMSKGQIVTRLLSSMSNIPVTKITSGRVSVDDLDTLANTAEELKKIPLYIDETSSLTVGALSRKARQFKKTHGGLDLVVIDYIQLMVGDRNNPNRVQEISEISRGLKALAKELNAPILALSQLSRQVEMRADKRPLLSDLRESGSLEQDADIVMFLYRDEYYNREGSDIPTIAELIIAKNRNGATGTIRLYFAKDTMRFKDLTRTEY